MYRLISVQYDTIFGSPLAYLSSIERMGAIMKLFLYVLISFFLNPIFVHAEPEEKLEQKLERTTGNNTLQTQLSKNVYRQEPYEDTYPIEVPYQEDETYYIDVPYQEDETYYVDIPYEEQESYTDYEEYWDRERICHTDYVNECRSERVCHTEYEQECRDERICHNNPSDRQCEMVEECGTNAHGERICKTRKVCHDVPGREECKVVPRCERRPIESCNYENVCHQVPRERCDYESVRKTRPVTKWRTVTKYRQEARTRTVTKYRQEARTRTVTKYRTEYVCCKTYYRQVYDHQETLSIKINIPETASLDNGEKEFIQVELITTGTTPDVKLDFSDTIYGYKIRSQNKKAGQIEIDLELIPKYQSGDLAEKTIQNLNLKIDQKHSTLTWVDQGVKRKINTTYKYQIFDKETMQLITEAVIASTGRKDNAVPLQTSLNLYNDYIIHLQVYRTGIILDKEVNFIKKSEYLFERLDSENYGRSTISNFATSETVTEFIVSMQDQGFDERFITQYVLNIKNAATEIVVHEKNILAKDVIDTKTKQVKIKVPIAALADKETYQVSIQIYRSGKILTKEVNFLLTTTYDRSLNKELFTNPATIHNLRISGDSAETFVEFIDEAPAHDAVETKYTISLVGPGGFLGLKREQFFSKSINKKDFAGKKIKLNLVKDLGLEVGKANRHLQPNATIDFNLKVERMSSRFEGGRAHIIQKTVKQKLIEN